LGIYFRRLAAFEALHSLISVISVRYLLFGFCFLFLQELDFLPSLWKILFLFRSLSFELTGQIGHDIARKQCFVQIMHFKPA